jgi:signal transduction histidine kinase
MSQNSISKHISFIVSGMLSIVLILLASGILYLKKAESNRRFQKDTDANLEFISKSIAEPLYTFNTKTIIAITSTYANRWDNSVSKVIVYDQQGKIVSESKNESLGELKDEPITEKSHSIKFDDSEIGRITIFSNEILLKAELKKWTKMLFIYTFLAILFLNILLNYLFYNLLTKPLKNLLSEISKLSQNDFSAKVSGDFKFEFNTIAGLFNEATTQIKERDDKINSYAHSLEETVITRTNERDEQSIKAQNSARLAALGEMSAEISHEINNPLSVISLLSDNVIKNLDQEKDKHNQNIDKLNKIKSMVNRIKKTSESIKRLSRDGKKEDFIEFKLNDLIEAIRDLTNFKLVSNNVEFELILKTNSTYIYGQEIQLSQVIVNLMNNAVDAISEFDEKWIKLEINEDSEFNYFSITDSGKGIPKEIVDKMMSPFFTTKASGKGTGLGLSIACEIIRDHQGELTYDESSPNTKFKFKIKKVIPKV